MVSTFFQTSFAGIILSCSLSHGEIRFPVQHPKDRFMQFINQIRPTMAEAAKLRSVDEQILYINNSGVRSNLSYLQNILDMYDGKGRFEKLKPFFESVKTMEDHISHYGDLQQFIGQAQGGGAAQGQKYRDLFEKEKQDYRKFLTDSRWMKTDLSEMDALVATLNSIDFQSLEKDRDFLLSRFAKTMSKQHEEKYDMKDYELGMHEFRRDARRISYMNASVGELVKASQDFNDNDCPLNKEVIENYPTRKENEESYICYVSRCLMDYLQRLQSDISEYKYKAQDYTIRGQEVPAEIEKGAQGVVDKMRASNVYRHLDKQITSCKTGEPKKKED